MSIGFDWFSQDARKNGNGSPADPYNTDIIGSVKPNTTPNRPWAWDDQDGASATIRPDGTISWYHDGPDSPSGGRDVYYVTSNDGTTKVRVECTFQVSISSGSPSEQNKFGICVGDNGGEYIGMIWAVGPGSVSSPNLDVIYHPTNDTLTGYTKLANLRMDKVAGLHTFIIEYDPSTGDLDCKISLSLEHSDAELSLYSGTQALSGTFERIGIYSLARYRDAVWANIHHFNWEEVV